MLGSKQKKYFCPFFVFILMIVFSSITYAKQINMTLVYDGTTHKYSAEEINIHVNDTPITDFAMHPIILDGRTLLPARAVFEALGCEVVWNAQTKEVYISRESDIIVLKVNSQKGSMNGEVFELEVAPKIINDSTMIPVRQVAEQLGCSVGWDNQTRVVSINESEEAPPEIPVDPPTTTDPPVVVPPQETVPPTVDTPVEVPDVTFPSIGNEISVQSIMVPSGANTDFMINASGVIEKYQSLEVSENRLVVDIYNANMMITNTNMALSGDSYVSSIRSAQNQVTPEKITRIVFDLKSASKYNISLSNDKKSILIRFSQNNISNIYPFGQGNSDLVMIEGDAAPGVQVSVLNDPKRIVLDMPNAKSLLSDSYSIAGCNFITDIKTSQFSENSVRVVLTIADHSSLEYSINQNGTKTIIELHKSSLQGVSYNPSDRTLTLPNLSGVRADQLIHNDDYMNKKYTLTLPGDYSSSLGYGTKNVEDAYLQKITFKNNASNQTEIIFEENQILAYTVTEGLGGLIVKVQLPKEKYKTVVLLDAGHGKADPGTSGNGYIEKNINLLVMSKVYAKMQSDPNIKVYATRLDDSYPTNPERAALANSVADLFVSIHQNSADPNAIPSGTEILYTPHSNEVSGKLTSKQAAEVMLPYVINAMGSKNRGVKNDPAIIVLNQTKVPAILIECGFLSNAEEAGKLGSDFYQEALADAIASGIRDIANHYSIR